VALTRVREGTHNARIDPTGLYFGAANGDVWATSNEGESWKRIAQYLPYAPPVHAATMDQTASEVRQRRTSG